MITHNEVSSVILHTIFKTLGNLPLFFTSDIKGKAARRVLVMGQLYICRKHSSLSEVRRISSSISIERLFKSLCSSCGKEVSRGPLKVK